MLRRVFLYSFLSTIPDQSPNQAFYTFSKSLISNFELWASYFTSMLIGWLICTFVGSLVSSFVLFSHQSLSLLRGQFLWSDLPFMQQHQPFRYTLALISHLRKEELSCIIEGPGQRKLRFLNQYYLHNIQTWHLSCGHAYCCVHWRICLLRALIRLWPLSLNDNVNC